MGDARPDSDERRCGPFQFGLTSMRRPSRRPRISGTSSYRAIAQTRGDPYEVESETLGACVSSVSCEPDRERRSM